MVHGQFIGRNDFRVVTILHLYTEQLFFISDTDADIDVLHCQQLYWTSFLVPSYT